MCFLRHFCVVIINIRNTDDIALTLVLVTALFSALHFLVSFLRLDALASMSFFCPGHLLQIGYLLSKIKFKALVSSGMQGIVPWMAPELLRGKDAHYTEKVKFVYSIIPRKSLHFYLMVHMYLSFYQKFGNELITYEV